MITFSLSVLMPSFAPSTSAAPHAQQTKGEKKKQKKVEKKKKSYPDAPVAGKGKGKEKRPVPGQKPKGKTPPQRKKKN